MRNGRRKSAEREVEMVKAVEEMTVLAHDTEARSVVPRSRLFRILGTPDLNLVRTPNVFVLTSAARLPEVTAFVRSVNQQHRLRALFIREDVDARLLRSGAVMVSFFPAVV